ncbi:MAG: hypothetical protein ACO3CE_05395 [Pelagibacteraceae bacterium]
MIRKLLLSYLLTSIVYLFGTLSILHAQLPGGMNVPGLGGGGKSSTVDLKAGKNELVKTFFVSFENYAQALILLSESLGLDAQAKTIKQALDDSKNVNKPEADRLTNSIKATSEVSKQVEDKLKIGNVKLDVKAKEKYAKSIPFVAKGLVGTLELRPKSQQMVSGIQANPMQAVSDLGPLSKAIPEVPNYITTIVSVTKLVVSGAEANNIEIKEVKSSLGKF